MNVSNIADRIGTELVRIGADNVPLIERDSTDPNAPARIVFAIDGDDFEFRISAIDGGFAITNIDGEPIDVISASPVAGEIRAVVSNALDS